MEAARARPVRVPVRPAGGRRRSTSEGAAADPRVADAGRGAGPTWPERQPFPRDPREPCPRDSRVRVTRVSRVRVTAVSA
jgi:hypothetical protein